MKKYIIVICIFFEILTLMASDVIEIPAYYNSKEGRLYVYGEFAGKNGYFILDTGSDTSIIFDDENNYKNFNKNVEYEKIDILNMSLKNLKCSTTKIKFGGTELKGNYTFHVTDNPLLIDYFSDNIKGILGLNIFYGKIFEISIHDGFIKIYNEKPDYYTNSFPILSTSHKVTVPINIDNYSYEALIDTGSYDFINLPSSDIFYKNKGLIDVYVIQDTSHIHNKNFSFLKKERVELMGVILKDKIFKTHRHNTIEPIAIIGNKFLCYFNILIDLKNKNNYRLYYISRIPNEYFSLFTNEEMNNIGIINVNLNGKNLEIYEVIKNSPAWNAGLRPGTLITEFNSQPILYYNLEIMKSFLLAPAPLKITFIDEDGKEKTVTIKARKIL